MNNLDETQPVDGYVRSLLKSVTKRYNLSIDLDRPTRSQRLEAALAIKDEANGFYSMEIMVGHRVDSSEPMAQTFTMLRIAEALGHSDPRRFYEGFAHQYWPKEE